MFTKGTWSTMIAGATVLAAATAAMAGVLAPSNASQSVVLRTNGVSTGCGGTSLDAAIDTRILSNGSTAPFTIPPETCWCSTASPGPPAPGRQDA